MTKYRPDFKLKKGLAYIDELPWSEEKELIHYVVNYYKMLAASKQGEIQEYKKFFNQLNKFLPHNPLKLPRA